jgi:hypothetical protein
MPGTDTYIYNVGSDLASALPNGWYQSFQGELSNGPYNLVIPVFLPTGSCTPGHVYSTQGTVIGKDNGDGGGITPGMFHGVHSNIFMYDIGNHQNWNSSGGTYSIENGSSGNNFGGNFVMGPVTLANGCVALAGQACATISAINSCPAATYPPNGTDCPLVLQAQIGDIMNVQCNSTATGTGGNPEFFTTGVLSSSGSPSTFGAYIISLDTVNQQWFTYVPSFAGGTPAAGATAQCELELPQTLPYYNGASGIYNGESYPKTQFFNHVSSVGMFGAYVYGSAFETNLSFLNGLAIVPGASDTCVPGIGAGTCAGTDAAGTGGTQTCGGSIRCGFAFNQSDSYTGSQCGGPGTNVTGITNGGDPGTLTFQSYGIGARTLANYPWWSGGATPPSCTSYFANMNSVPINAATSGTSGVQCSQSANGNPPLVACTTVNALAGYIYPTSVGFVGSLNTTVYPINASGFASPYTNDFRGYVLDNSSPYKAGGMFQASDGLDNNFILSYFLNANARSVRPTWILSNYPNGGTTTYTYYPDGPQYAWMTWTATSSPYSIYENGTSCGSPGTIVGTTSNTYYQAYGLPNTGSFYWIVKDSTGACLTISGEPLTSQIAYMSAGSPIALPVQPPTGLQILNNNGFVESNNGSIQ